MSIRNYPPDHPGHSRLIKDLKLRPEPLGWKRIEGELAKGWKIVFGPKEATNSLGEIWFTPSGSYTAKRYEPGMPVRRCDTLKEACAFLEGHI